MISESTSDSDSNSKWQTDDVMQAFDEDSYDGSDSEENDFQSKDRPELSRINYRWIEWVSSWQKQWLISKLLTLISLTILVSQTTGFGCKSTIDSTQNLPQR